MKAKDFLKDLLEGGIPSAIDGIRSTNDPKPEQAAPTGTVQDRIPGLNFFGGNGAGITQPQIFGAAALILGVLGIIYLMRR